MTLDATVRALLDDATPLVHKALQDNTLEMIVNAVKLPVSDLLQRAYEVGFREGLAARPGTESFGAAMEVGSRDWNGDFEPEGRAPMTSATPSPHAAPAEESSAPNQEGTLASAPGNDSPAELDWGAPSDHERPGRSARSRQTASLRIFPHATIATLRERIVDTFGLERFDIEVVITRPGDKARRQLKGSVKLSKYLLEREG
ncbi:MAG: hypothetical protein IPM35_19425 [Myxococcales bacterium]|nr:hypothetical protein [Myxococcales bacterium]